jgi:uncharacterized phage protein gp47/JayE
MYENEISEDYWEQLAIEMGEELGVDTREGSVYMDTQAGHILRVCKFFNDLNTTEDMFAIDTCSGDILTEKAAMDGIYRDSATPAYWTAVFEGSTPESGAEFMCGDYYLTWQAVNDDYLLVAQDSGSGANSLNPGDTLIPMENIDGLVSATLGKLITPGADEEDDETLRGRWQTAKSGPAENGNKSHYKTWCESVTGVGRARILPLWAGENTVKAVLFSSDGTDIKADLVAKVQKYVDPIDEGFKVDVDGITYTFGDGVGEGVANLGAHFLATSVQPFGLNVEATVTLKSGYTIEQAKQSAKEGIVKYLKELALGTDDDTEEIVRISSIGSIINNLDAVLDYDYSTLLINGENTNITIDLDHVAILSGVILNVGA